MSGSNILCEYCLQMGNIVQEIDGHTLASLLTTGAGEVKPETVVLYGKSWG